MITPISAAAPLLHEGKEKYGTCTNISRTIILDTGSDRSFYVGNALPNDPCARSNGQTHA
jgi:hypothetical protein